MTKTKPSDDKSSGGLVPKLKAAEETQRRPLLVLMILHGIARSTPTAQMARELGCDRHWLPARRHRLQDFAPQWLDRNLNTEEIVT